ncbi:MAG: aquaporin [Calditrichaeota bacterium]|nr:aquaporin [Calditrichota bacterium]
MSLRALLAEFIGTFSIVFVGVGAIVADDLTNGAVGLTGVALAFTFVVAAMATATIPVSGGHLNPAVSLGMLISGRMSAKDFAGYVVAQCLGGIAASALLMKSVSPLSLEAVNYGITSIGESATPGMGVIVEIAFTFLLMFVIFATVLDKRAPMIGAIYIGLSIGMGVFVAGPISGGAFNPARWLGPAVISGDYMNAWVYIVGPLAGGVLGAVLCTWLFDVRSGESV